jgi:Cof subfamily protein (haloacid dehalogenase superfamily)
MQEYKIVFSDIDGTLLNSEHKVTKLTRDAIIALQGKGIPFVPISARSPSGIYPILLENGFNCPIIAYSGGLILDEKRNILLHIGIDMPEANEIIEYIESEHFDASWCIYSLDEWIVKDKKDPRIIREEQIVKAQAKQGSVFTLQTDSKINKILCICNPEHILEIEYKLKRKFPKYSIVKSSDILIEIMQSGVTKASAVKAMCSTLKIDTSAAIAFGDNYNDCEMLKIVGCGFVMGNSPKIIKMEVGNVTLDNDHNGIPAALNKIGLF